MSFLILICLCGGCLICYHIAKKGKLICNHIAKKIQQKPHAISPPGSTNRICINDFCQKQACYSSVMARLTLLEAWTWSMQFLEEWTTVVVIHCKNQIYFIGKILIKKKLKEETLCNTASHSIYGGLPAHIKVWRSCTHILRWKRN